MRAEYPALLCRCPKWKSRPSAFLNSLTPTYRTYVAAIWNYLRVFSANMSNSLSQIIQAPPNICMNQSAQQLCCRVPAALHARAPGYAGR